MIPSLLQLDISHPKNKNKVDHQQNVQEIKPIHTIKVAIDIFGFGVTFFEEQI